MGGHRLAVSVAMWGALMSLSACGAFTSSGADAGGGGSSSTAAVQRPLVTTALVAAGANPATPTSTADTGARAANAVTTEKVSAVDDGVLELGGAMSLDGAVMTAVVVAIVPAPSGAWIIGRDGGVFALGGATFRGSAVGRLKGDAVGGFAWGDGYVVVGVDGSFLTFSGSGAAPRPTGLRGKVVEVIPTRRGGLIVTDTGDVASVGASLTYQAPGALDVVSAGVTADEQGAWLVRRSGDVVTVGSAAPLPNVGLDVVSVVAESTAIFVVHRDGSVSVAAGAGPAFAPRCGPRPVVGALARGGGWWLVTSARAPVVTKGLEPIAALDAVNSDLVDQMKLSQSCQNVGDIATLVAAKPLRNGRVSSRYGKRIHPVYKVPQFHRGVDLAGGDGRARALADGTVIDVSTRVGYGTMVVIDHGGRRVSLGAHLASTAVKVGDVVTAGQVIGKVGSTGYATGPHLHVEVRVNGEVIDPEPIVARAK
jgi:Peptidase family M23